MTKAYSYIRFSRPEQIKGNSLNRQKEMSDQYCKANGLTLDTSLSLYDKGISAYRGKNVEQGALAGFLKAINKGKVESGSYLLVESLDRLSRQTVTTALRLFLNILEKGIIIVTLSDGRKYDDKDIDTSELIISITIMTRAHEESKIKSQRLLAANKTKRNNIKQKKLTSICPSWLKLNSEKTEFTIIKSKAKTIHYIFELSAAGMGTYSIISKLTKRKIKPIGDSGKWYQSYLTKILTGREVLGEFISNSKDGTQTFEDYYPKIISKDLYYKVQKSIKSRTKSSGGRKGKHFTNLFSKLAYCGYSIKPEVGFKCTGTNEAMIHANKGKYSYLQCRAHKTGNSSCKNISRLWRYDDFEYSLLTSLTEIDASELFTNKDKNKIRDLEVEINTLSGELENTTNKINNVINAITSGISVEKGNTNYSPALAKKLKELESKQSLTEKSLHKKKESLAINKNYTNTPKNNAEKLRSLIKTLPKLKEEELYMLRLKISELLKSSINRIDVYCSGLRVSPLNPNKTPSKHKYFLAIVRFKSGSDKYIRSTPIGNGFNFHMFASQEDLDRRMKEEKSKPETPRKKKKGNSK